MKRNRSDVRFREIFDCNLGWDITDFGQGDFSKVGLLLFTLRNGVNGSAVYSKPYSERPDIAESVNISAEKNIDKPPALCYTIKANRLICSF